MRSKIIAGAVAIMALAAAAPAFAHGNGDGGKGDRPSFPMPAAQFQQRIDAKQAKMREHMEKRASQLPADQAKDVRAKFDAKVAQMNAEVAKAVADGTVTKEEAKAVRAVAGHHHGEGHRGGDKGAEKK